jgi:spore coat polysaccharide biosynthesis protein SpsF
MTMIVAVLQARFSSSRLPGKVLKPILGKPMLALQVERIKRVKLIDKLIIATSDGAEDDKISELCEEINTECFRGSLDDVLDRFYQAVRLSNPEHIVRLTGDCPLCDPILIDTLIDFHLAGNYDYSCNTLRPTYPDGLDIEVCRFSCLATAYQEAFLPSHREHVTQFMHRQPERFKIGDYQSDVDRSDLRWTVDEQLDFELVTKIYESLYPQHPDFTTQDILNWLEANPEWRDYNTRYQRNEGLTKSLLADIDYMSHHTQFEYILKPTQFD